MGKKKLKKHQLSEFDILTCEGFDELFHLVKIKEITIDNDTAFLLLARLVEQYPAGTYERRMGAYKLFDYIRSSMVGKLVNYSNLMSNKNDG